MLITLNTANQSNVSPSGIRISGMARRGEVCFEIVADVSHCSHLASKKELF